MKDWQKALLFLLGVFTVVSATLYWTKPRTVIQYLPAATQDSTVTYFPPTPPDTTYIIEYKEHFTAIHDTVRIEIPGSVEPVDTSATICVAEKTFKQTLVGASVESQVKTYSFGPVFDIENTIATSIDKKWLSSVIEQAVEEEGGKQFRKGLYVGGGVAVAATVGIVLLAK